MSSDAYIPVGRTSLAKNGKVAYQVQTEYASRPYPRVTTTVLTNGEVVKKIEKKLLRPVTSPEDKHHAETLIRCQHEEVVAIIQNKPAGKKPAHAASGTPSGKKAPLHEQFAALPGFQHLYRLDCEGAFVNEKLARHFKKAFPSVFKHLPEILELFPFVPGGLPERQKGVYEVERDRLYFVSAGSKCYFIVVRPTSSEIDYEAALQKILRKTD
jgi:hypothetical protein